MFDDFDKNVVLIKSKQESDVANNIFEKYNAPDFTEWLDIIVHNNFLEATERDDKERAKRGEPVLKLREDVFPSYYKLSKLKQDALNSTWFALLNIKIVTTIFSHGKEISKAFKEAGLENLSKLILSQHKKSNSDKKIDRKSKDRQFIEDGLSKIINELETVENN